MEQQELELEILKVRQNKVLAKYLMDTAQYLYSDGNELKFKSIFEDGNNEVSNLFAKPTEVHPAQNQFL